MALIRSGNQADRALKRLAGAVLIQALQDASSGPRRFREEALEWINGKETDGLSFDLCCSLLNRSPDDVRSRLMKHNFIPKFDPTLDEAAYPYDGYSSGYSTTQPGNTGPSSYAAKAS
jgi:hypothetical protein